MDSWFFSFITASVISLFWWSLPPTSLLPILLFIGLVCIKFRFGVPLSGFIFGSLWMASVGHWYLHWQMNDAEIRSVTQIQGEVLSVSPRSEGVSMYVAVNKLDGAAPIISPRIKLTWEDPVFKVISGQKLLLVVSLKPAHGLANEGGFLYQQHLRSKSVVATGYVKSTGVNALVSSSQSLRARLLGRLLAQEHTNLAWLAALSFGDRSLFSQQQWKLIQSTGVAHLVAISGLHLSTIFAVVFAVCSALLRGITGILSIPNCINYRQYAVVVSFVAAIFYAYLADFSIPTVRALFMLGILSLAFVLKRNWSVWRVILYALFAMIVIDPMSIFGVSLWLSLLSVGMVCLVLWRLTDQTSTNSMLKKLWILILLQFSLTFLMAPLIGLLFASVSVVSPLVNLLAIPVVTWLILPLCLIASLLLVINLSAAQWVYSIADVIIDWSISLLVMFQQWPNSLLNFKFIPFGAWLFLLLAIVILFLPRSPLGKSIALIFALPFLSYLLQNKEQGWQVDVLDVGQGLAVVIRANGRAMIYDVGAAFPSGFNMADAVIIPFLISKGIKRVDYVVISHFDNDHAGSLPALQQQIPIHGVISTKNLCTLGNTMSWQSLRVTFLWPKSNKSGEKNEHSCVVKISDGQFSILLPGDIGKAQERTLIEIRNELKSDILIAPHHGSNTSSSREFIEAVKPEFVVFSQGYFNRWQFPKQRVVTRYYQQGVKMFATSQHGQIHFNIGQGVEVTTFRRDIFPYWYANHFAAMN